MGGDDSNIHSGHVVCHSPSAILPKLPPSLHVEIRVVARMRSPSSDILDVGMLGPWIEAKTAAFPVASVSESRSKCQKQESEAKVDQEAESSVALLDKTPESELGALSEASWERLQQSLVWEVQTTDMGRDGGDERVELASLALSEASADSIYEGWFHCHGGWRDVTRCIDS